MPEEPTLLSSCQPFVWISRRDEPQPIPEEDENVEPLPGPACEPLVIDKQDVAKKVFPLLPQDIRDHYVKVGKGKGKPPIDLLAWDLGALYKKGGLNSPEQRIKKARVFDKKRGKYMTKDVIDWEHITRGEAYRFMAGYHEFRDGEWGVAHMPLASALMTFIPPGADRPIIESLFFPEAPLDGKSRRAAKKVPYIPATITGISDGDTINMRILRDGCATEEGSIRFAGIDTPEKFRSEAKFWPQAGAVMNLWKDQGLITASENIRSGPVETLLANRMEYAGAVSSMIMKDFLGWAISRGSKFFPEETYNRVLKDGDDPAGCDFVTLYDIYLRMIWVVRVRVEPPELLAEYIEKRIAGLMKGEQGFNLMMKFVTAGGSKPIETNGAELWAHHQLGWLLAHASAKDERVQYAAAKEYLAKLRRDGRNELADLLDPAKIPQPAVLYSKEKVAKILAAWKEFVSKHPDRSGDINAAMIAMGAAYVYTKYRNEHTDAYLEMGNKVKGGGVGLWGEETVRILDPNVHGLDKENRRFVPYEIPPDCLGNQ